jgi:hypothetical protein
MAPADTAFLGFRQWREVGGAGALQAPQAHLAHSVMNGYVPRSQMAVCK